MTVCDGGSKIIKNSVTYFMDGPHVERKSGDDWVSACRNVVVAGVRCAGGCRKTWKKCVEDDMDELGLHSEWVVFRDMWRDLISGKTSDPS